MARLQTVKPRLATFDARAIKPEPKRADAIYATPEYAAWRAAVIARAGGRCQWPGCGRIERRMFADHVVEVKDDRTRAFDVTNGQCLCGRHHTIKTAQARAARAAASPPG